MLRGQGLELQHLVRCTVTLADMADWPAFNEVYREFFGSNGLAFNAAARLNDHMQLNAGLGYGANQNLFGGRVGVRLGW